MFDISSSRPYFRRFSPTQSDTIRAAGMLVFDVDEPLLSNSRLGQGWPRPPTIGDRGNPVFRFGGCWASVEFVQIVEFVQTQERAGEPGVEPAGLLLFFPVSVQTSDVRV